MLYFPVRRSWPKYCVALVTCTLLRLIPGRPPNLEPVLATVMPLSKAFGALDSALFAALNIVIFDLLTGKAGSWTILTAVTYGAIAGSGTFFFRRYEGRFAYLGFAVIGTLVFDGITGVLSGPVFYAQPLAEAFFGQIPFTINHLLGNLLLALVLSPLLERWITVNPKLDGLTLFQAVRR